MIERNKARPHRLIVECIDKLGRTFFCCIGDAFPWVFFDLRLQYNRSPQRRLLVREGGISTPIIRVNEAAIYYEEHGVESM